tara:strand:- start:394 stop:1107 length:714 start_codon:yes stop_codon:yes gene_type:complete
MKVLVLGHKGMLGHMVTKYLTDQNLQVVTIQHRYPSIEFKEELTLFDGGYIINCIGSIPQRTDIFDLNYELPLWLEKNTSSKIIHPGTDCEMDNDGYGVSKKQARDFIVKEGTHTKIIKSSIIGPEVLSSFGLMDWFLSQEGEVGGYTKALWSGNTTLEWAKKCFDLIFYWDDYKTENILEGECLSKFDLLNLIKEIFKKDININPNDSVVLNKCLKGDIQTSNIKTQLKELKEYYF